MVRCPQCSGMGLHRLTNPPCSSRSVSCLHCNGAPTPSCSYNPSLRPLSWPSQCSKTSLSQARSYAAHRDVPVPSLPLTVDTNDEQPRVRQQAVGRRWTLLARRTRGDRWRSGGTQRVTCSSQVHWWSTVRQKRSLQSDVLQQGVFEFIQPLYLFFLYKY